MNTHDWHKQEYQLFRLEVNERIRLLHHLIALGTILGFFALLSITYLWSIGQPTELFILGLPIIFAGLTFNYQANQMTLEGVAGYTDLLSEHHKAALGDPPVTWSAFYGKRKLRYQMTSFLKTLPLLLPQILPFILYLPAGFPAGSWQQTLLAIDGLFFLLVLANFRYKL